MKMRMEIILTGLYLIYETISFLYSYYITMAKKPLTIEERLALLDEAYVFFTDLSDAGQEAEHLWLRKAAALGTVKSCLAYYKDKIMNDAERTEDELAKAMEVSIDEWAINSMVALAKMTDEEKDFYEWWFGLAIWILEGDEDTIKGLRQLQAEYDNIVQAKLQNKTIGDLLK